ncbi:MAG TPA: CocE/NonD family hydrolase [Streptosporangiaceae bacterium]
MPEDFERTTEEPVPDTATQYMVRMRDGVRLATDVYLPDDGAAAEAVLVRLPYDKNSRYVFFAWVAEIFTRRGYALVVQDVRGKFRSEGETLGFAGEANDGYDTIDWIVAQPWSNGVVGMFGDSYYGFTQWAAVSSGHRALRAIVPRVTSAELLGATHAGDGVRDVPWLVHADYVSHYWLDRHIYARELDWNLRPLTEVFEDMFRSVGARSAIYDASVPHRVPLPVYPDGHPFDARPVPVLHAVGWFDNLSIVSMRDYMALSRRPGWAAVQYLTADSVDHENYHLSHAPIAEHDDHGVNDEALARMLVLYTEPALDFFDVFLKGTKDASTLPKVSWHLGHEGYHEAASWPPPGARERHLHLTGLAAAATSGGRLADDAPAGEQAGEWVYDPQDLIASSVPNSFAFLHEFPDESATAARPDVLSFTSEPATAPVDLAGPVDLLVTVSSTAPSAYVFAKLLDESPDGTARMIVRGQGELADVSGTSRVRIEMGQTGYRLRPGHRFRLNVTSSDFPEYMRHPGTDENPWLATRTKPSTQRLISRPGAPASLRLTVLGEG